MNATFQPPSRPPGGSGTSGTSSGAGSTPFADADRLRLRLQQLAVRQRQAGVEQRVERERRRRLAEWSQLAGRYMAAERQLHAVRQLAVEQVRSDQLDGLLAGAKLEVQRHVGGVREAAAVLGRLAGTNISGASMEQVR